MKVIELQGAALDWAVAKCEVGDAAEQAGEWWTPSTNWAQGGPIIEREGISVSCWAFHSIPWKAEIDGEFETLGFTPLIAAMRCYVASKLGDDIELPEELK
jgi:hypothetical protein